MRELHIKADSRQTCAGKKRRRKGEKERGGDGDRGHTDYIDIRFIFKWLALF